MAVVVVVVVVGVCGDGGLLFGVVEEACFC